MDIVNSLDTERNAYSFDYLSCFDKPMGLSLNIHGWHYETLFYIYLKLFQSYRISTFPLSELFFHDYAYQIRHIIEDKLKLVISIERGELASLHSQIESLLSNGQFVLITINLSGMYYSSNYKRMDERYLLILNGYDSKKKLYSIIDTIHTELDGHKRGLIYKPFVIEYGYLERLYDLYEKVFGYRFIVHTNNNNGVHSNDILRSCLIDCINLYLDAREDQPFREMEYIEKIGTAIEQKSDILLDSSLNYEPATHIDFAFKVTLNYKHVFYNELFKLIKSCHPDSRLMGECETLKVALLGQWNQIFTHSLIRYYAGKKLRLDGELDKAVALEERIKENIAAIEKELCKKKEFFVEMPAADIPAGIESAGVRPLRDEAAYEEPRTDLERELISLWQSVFKTTQAIGIHDRFFELGGHSLTAVRLLSMILKNYHVELPVHLFFNNPTIADLAELIYQDRNTYESLPSPIPKAEEQDYYPLSAAQGRLFVLNQLDCGIAYNISIEMNIGAEIDRSKMEYAFRELIKRHESLRTCFKIIDNIPMQCIAPQLDFRIDYAEISEEELEKCKQSFIRPFDLSRLPLIRVLLVKLPAGNTLILDIHHIVADGISIGILIKEFEKLYNGEPPAPPPQIQYKDYTVWHQTQQRSERIKKQEQYWLDRYQNGVSLLSLPFDFQRPNIQSFEGNTFSFQIDSGLASRLRASALEYGISLYMMLFAAFNVLLHKYTGQDDIIIGSPIADRPHIDLFDVVGMFVNMMPILNHPSSGKIFEEFLLEIKENALKAYENQDCQFEVLVDQLGLKGTYDSNPLFNVVFVLQNIDLDDFQMDGTAVRPKQIKNRISKFDLMLEATETDSRIDCVLEYSTRLFKKSTIIRLSKHYRNILEAILKNPRAKISEIDILSPQERKQLLEDFNATGAPYSRNRLIHQLFEENARRMPDQTAVFVDEKSLSYRQLNECANQLAHALRANGVGRGTIVAIFMDRTVNMVIATLSVLKAGGIYVPIEEHLPEKRIVTILNSLGIAHIILHGERQQQALAALSPKLTALNRIYCSGFSLEGHEPRPILPDLSSFPIQVIFPEDIDQCPAIDPEPLATPQDIAYIIFTSGSTGVPKGVAVTHRPVVNLIEWVNRTFEVGSSDRLLFVTSLSFDLSVYDIFGILAAGGSIRPARQDELKEPSKLLRILTHEGITFWDSAPAALQQLAPLMEGIRPGPGNMLRLVFLSGDWIPVNMPDEVRKCFTNARVISLGGATEAAIWSNYYPIDKVDPSWRSIPYGRPIQNAKYYILDKQLQPCPIGVAGDLYIGGECLASGYINDEQLTAQKFIPNPFVPGQTMYYTADTARFFEDGNIEFLGRKDNQVKVRGFRIELGEIESVLLRYEGIEKAVVVLKETGPDQKYLCGYYVSNQRIEPSLIRDFLYKELPEYMIPSFLAQLEDIPVTPNGKVDRKGLPDIAAKADEVYYPPADEKEKQVATIWENVFKRKPISVRSNFFNIGGHSLLAVQLINSINKNMGCDLPVASLFQAPTIERITALISTTGNKAAHFDPVILMRGGSEAAPIFFVHPGGGDVFCYTTLAGELGDKRPFYGIKAFGLDAETRAYNRFEEMAEKYVCFLRRAHPNGPHVLAGFCAGGTLAYHMAQTLSRMGERVERLILVDSLAPDFYRTPAGDLDYFMAFVRDFGGLANINLLPFYCRLRGIGKRKGYRSIVEDVQRQTREQRFRLLYECAKNAGIISNGFDIDDLVRIADVHAGIYEGLSHYRPQPYGGPIVLIKADGKNRYNPDLLWGWHEDRLTAELTDSFRREALLGWDRYSEDIQLETLPGAHFELLVQPNVSKLAKIINYYLTNQQ